MNKIDLLKRLPPYRDEWIVINKSQSVPDIIREVCDAHRSFTGLYDRIWMYFDEPTTEEICNKLVRFCKANIHYREESDKSQTTAIPQGLLTRGYGDCKHYASFCGGVLGAINRATGKHINWHYRFASYRLTRRTPYHVFVVVQKDGEEIWLDPTPGSDNQYPIWVQNRKVE